MSIKIVRQGVMDSIQDSGRYGYQHTGINPGGAVDNYASRIVNALVGNGLEEAVIEMHFPACQLLFEKDALIAIGGADWQPLLNDLPVPMWQPVLVRRNTILQFPDGASGMRVYLAIAGGIVIEEWLSGKSTLLKWGRGGFKGRRLQVDDTIQFTTCAFNWGKWVHDAHILQALPWFANHLKWYKNTTKLYYIKGREWGNLQQASQLALATQKFQIQPASDRMGYQLMGPSLHSNADCDCIAAGVSSGTIQLLPSGQLVVLVAEHQVIGSLPRIGHIIGTHLPKLAQMRPGQYIQFFAIEPAAAENRLFEMEQEIRIIRQACSIQLEDFKKKEDITSP